MAFLCKKCLSDAPKSLCLNTSREKREGEWGRRFQALMLKTQYLQDNVVDTFSLSQLTLCRFYKFRFTDEETKLYKRKATCLSSCV